MERWLEYFTLYFLQNEIALFFFPRILTFDFFVCVRYYHNAWQKFHQSLMDFSHEKDLPILLEFKMNTYKVSIE